jgi:hypothetical protein
MVAATHQRINLLTELGRGQVHRGVRVVSHLLRLLGSYLCKLGASIADVDTSQTGRSIEIGRAVGIYDCRALASGNYELTLFKRAMLHEGMQLGIEILLYNSSTGFGIGCVG